MRSKITFLAFIALYIAYGFWISHEMMFHHYWKDEVRALAIAEGSHSFGDIFSNLFNEGHPPLWHLFLYGLKGFVPLEQVLGLASFICAMALVGVFLFLSPFHWLIKLLFPFTIYPAFEYSIMSRNYAIAVVPMLFAAYLYSKKIHLRSRGGAFLYAFMLVLMGMSHAISLIFAGFLLLDWVVGDTVFNKNRKQFFLTKLVLQIAVAAIFLWICFLLAPPKNSMVVKLEALTPARIWWAFKLSIQNPSASFRRLVTTFDIPFLKIGTLHTVFVGALFSILWVYFDRRAKIFFPVFMISIAVFFKIIYFADVRHVGIVFFAMIYCLWRSPNAKDRVPQMVLFCLFLAQVPSSVKTIKENRWSAPSNAMLTVDFFKNYKPAANAMVMGEPDASLEEFAVYIPQPLYMHRQNAFRKWLINTSNARENYTLRELVDEALKKPKDVFLVFVLSEFTDEPTTINSSYSGILTWNKSDVAYLKANYKRLEFFKNPQGTNPYQIWEPIHKKEKIKDEHL